MGYIFLKISVLLICRMKNDIRSYHSVISQEKRGLVMSIFNWGIYGGYGIAFPVGRYVTEMNSYGLVS